MKAIIQYGMKRVDIGVADLVDAGWIGFNFAKSNPDLVKVGWNLYYYPLTSARFDASGVVEVSSSVTLASMIRKGPPPPPCDHSCPRHEAVE